MEKVIVTLKAKDKEYNTRKTIEIYERNGEYYMEGYASNNSVGRYWDVRKKLDVMHKREILNIISDFIKNNIDYDNISIDIKDDYLRRKLNFIL